MTDASAAERAHGAREAGRRLARASDERRRATLYRFAELLEETEPTRRGDPTLSQAVEAFAEAPAPLDDVDDLDLGSGEVRARVPVGLLAGIVEDELAAVELAAAAIRTGNGILLDVSHIDASKQVLDRARRGLDEAGLPADALAAIDDPDAIDEATRASADLVLVRGEPDLVAAERSRWQVPVLGPASEVCHTYVDGAADLDEAARLCRRATSSRDPRASDTVLVHEAVAEQLVPDLADALEDEGLQVRAGEAARRRVLARLPQATGQTWASPEPGTVGLRLVGSLDEAIEHVVEFGGHTDALLTREAKAAREFLQAVPSAELLWNAATIEAEPDVEGPVLGFSTGAVHARGAYGMRAVTTTKRLVTRPSPE